MIPRDSNGETWEARARCATADPEIFFPPRDKARYKTIAAEAKSYCLGPNGNSPCPVRSECLWTAINTDEQHGIWGGMSHRERNALVRKWQRQYKSKMTLEEYVYSLDNKENQ